MEGAATIACAALAAFILPDYPATTRQLSSRQREIAVQRLKDDSIVATAEDNPSISAIQAIRESLTNWRTWLLTLGYMV